MNVMWINRFGEALASYRYRSAMPSTEVAKVNGFKTMVNGGEADVVIFSKPCQMDVALAEQCRKDGTPFIADLSDDHFDDMEAETYRWFATEATHLVTATNIMRGRIYDYVKREAWVIPDPYEQEECEPHADGDDFLWFGHHTNLRDLVTILGVMGTRRLRVVTGPKEFPNTIPWTPQNMKEAFALSNIALLPTRAGAEYKSPNRLLNSIRAGLFPLCASHPAYEEFTHFVWVGHVQTGLKWVDAFKQDLNGLVKQAQDYIRDRYSPEAIGQQWAQLLHSL